MKYLAVVLLLTIVYGMLHDRMLGVVMRKKKIQVRPYDAASYFTTEEDCALYLQAAIEEAQGDPEIIIIALGDIARARGMMQLARETGLTREGLYKALSSGGNPSFATVLKVCQAFGLKFHTQAISG